MKITVLGRGAVGGVLGGLLSLSGHSVYFVPKEKGRGEPRPPARPLRLILPDGWRLASPSVKSEPPELLLVALGRHHLRLLRKDSFKGFMNCPVILANGDPAEPERLGFEHGRAWHLLTLLEAVSLQEGEAELHPGSILVMQKGSPFSALTADLSKFGVSTRLVDDVVPFLNSFFVFQLLYLPAALCNTTLAHFLSFREGRDLAQRLMGEGLRLQEKTGRKTARLPAMDPGELLERLERSGKGFDDERSLPGRAYSPILQDLLTGKPTEAREITKRAVEAASSAGMEMPWNWKLYQKAGRVATLGWYRSPAELSASLS